jgi:CheY-like chemotaxis protein
MRSSIRSQVSSLGVEQTSVAATVRDALEVIKTSNRFDIILCDYYLGGATDGQQFLEFYGARDHQSGDAVPHDHRRKELQFGDHRGRMSAG